MQRTISGSVTVPGGILDQRISVLYLEARQWGKETAGVNTFSCLGSKTLPALWEGLLNPSPTVNHLPVMVFLLILPKNQESFQEI